jgi:hypothetical protein
MPLDCWWKNATYELIVVPERSSNTMLVHHVNHGHGAGMVGDDMLLLGIRQNHFVTLLRTSEHRLVDISGTGKTVEQTSTLQPFPDGSLEETRATTLHEMVSKSVAGEEKSIEKVRLTTIERRRWRWNKVSQSFAASAFVTVKP